MSASTFTDTNGYVYTAEVDDTTTPPQIDAGGQITCTAPSGETNQFSLSDVTPCTDPADPNSALSSYVSANPTAGYPITAAEQSLIDACNAITSPLSDLIGKASMFEAGMVVANGAASEPSAGKR